MDFSHYEKGNRYYAGSERKLCLVSPDGACYMAKFPKIYGNQKTHSHVSEFLGSRIFSIAGLVSQEVYLGTYEGEEVVLCRDFNDETHQFVPFNGVGESSLDDDKESYRYEYDDIMRMLHDNVKLTNVGETISTFWRMYVIDALIGNFDRHGSNWGFLKKENQYELAPIFDNGSCLFPRLTDDNELQRVLLSRDEIDNRLYKFPTSQIQLEGRKSSYFDVINSCKFPECNKALIVTIRNLDMRAIHDQIGNTEFISDKRREFLHYMIDQRYKHILLASYNKLRDAQ